MTTSTRQAANHQLVISSDTLGQIVAHLQSWLPYEGCGLIATEGDRVVRRRLEVSHDLLQQLLPFVASSRSLP
jgi:hypothetical protein